VDEELQESGNINTIIKHEFKSDHFLVATVTGLCFVQLNVAKNIIVPVKKLYFLEHNIRSVVQAGENLFVVGFGNSKTKREADSSD